MNRLCAVALLLAALLADAATPHCLDRRPNPRLRLQTGRVPLPAHPPNLRAVPSIDVTRYPGSLIRASRSGNHRLGRHQPAGTRHRCAAPVHAGNEGFLHGRLRHDLHAGLRECGRARPDRGRSRRSACRGAILSNGCTLFAATSPGLCRAPPGRSSWPPRPTTLIPFPWLARPGAVSSPHARRRNSIPRSATSIGYLDPVLSAPPKHSATTPRLLYG